MLALPAALSALAAHRQFVVVKLVPSAKPGKTDKMAMDPRSGTVSDAHDPAIWLSATEAYALANSWGPANTGDQHGFCVGFVLTEQDPFFCLDIDGALQADGTWSPLSQTLSNALAGCGIEVSISGQGLHIWGTYAGRAPEHRKKNVKLGLELYTEKRLIALGAASHTAIGNAGAAPVNFGRVLDFYFKPDPGAGQAAPDWDSGPVQEWSGPEDDEELIRRFVGASDAGAAFGTKCPNAALWNADGDVLAKFYPPSTGSGYDASSADLGLANRLAWWTGKDCARIERLMRRSALAREKWDSHPNYLRELTILNAVRHCQTVMTARPSSAPVAAGSLATPAAGPSLHAQQLAQPATTGAEDWEMGEKGLLSKEVQGSTFLMPPDQRIVFEGCVYVAMRNQVLVPGGELVDSSRFNVLYGGYCFAMDARNERTSRKAWEAFTESQVLRPPVALDTTFKPKLPYGVIVNDGGRRLVNCYLPLSITRTPGDPSPFLAHLAKVLPDQQDQLVLLSFMASAVQNKGVKFSWAPVLQGVEGNGKSLFSKVMTYCLGKRYVHWPRASQIASHFNAWMANKLLYCVEDIHTPGIHASVDVLEELKPLITQDEGITIERKGVDQASVDVCGNFMFNMNSKVGLKKTRNDRRLAFLFMAQQAKEDLRAFGMTPAYFQQLWQWLDAGGYAIVHEILATWPIPEQYDPARGARVAPETSSQEEALNLGRGRLEQEVLEAVASGMPGFQGDWISSTALDTLLQQQGRGVRLPREGQITLLESLGYVPHPGLPEGRARRPIPPDIRKPVLFVRRDSAAWALRGDAIENAYSQAQTLGLQ